MSESSKPHSQLGAGRLPLGIPDCGKETPALPWAIRWAPALEGAGSQGGFKEPEYSNPHLHLSPRHHRWALHLPLPGLAGPSCVTLGKVT